MPGPRWGQGKGPSFVIFGLRSERSSTCLAGRTRHRYGARMQESQLETAQLETAQLETAQLETARLELRAARVDDDQLRSEMLAFCHRHPNALWRTCLAGHLTGSALVVDPATRRVLLLHHAKLGRWLQPGGHADGEGDLGSVALREAQEETGLTHLRLVRPAIDLDIHEIPERDVEPAHVHLDVRYLVLADATEHRINEESTEARWIDPDLDADLPASQDLRRLVRAGLGRLDELNRRRSGGRTTTCD